MVDPPPLNLKWTLPSASINLKQVGCAALKKLHTGQENPLSFVLLESFKGKPEVWKQIEKDGRALSPAKFNEGRGKKSKALSDYHDAVRTKSNRGRKPKAQ